LKFRAPEIQTNGIPLGACAARAGATDGAESINSKGYGRAVDIWSGGCVVLEMLTGKKPFHYLNHEFQVIYQLGMGIAPRIPPEVQRMEMAYEFLRSCFIVEAQLRPQAKELLQHPFANIIPQVQQYDS
jgi:serine/threonine protein kinase